MSRRELGLGPWRRAAKQLEPTAWPRMLELLIDSLRETTPASVPV